MAKERVETTITDGIRISVRCEYQAPHSNPAKSEYVFAYWVTIANESPYTVQLLKRHWIIFDSVGTIREVKGEGVIGEQPVLKPGELHKYSSWCPLSTAVGKMKGSFEMRRTSKEQLFHVTIPEFNLVADFKQN